MDNLYLAGIAHLAQDEYKRVLRNCGVSQADADLLMASKLWMNDQRRIVRRTLDAYIHASCDMNGLPPVEVSAEIVSSIIAAVISPLNWMIAVSWQQGLKRHADLMEDEQTVSIESVSAPRLLALVHAAYAAYHSSADFDDLSAKIGSKIAKLEARAK